MGYWIKAKKDLFHSDGTKSFIKGEKYKVNTELHNEASLIDARTTNDQGEQHLIGSWWRDFTILR